MIERIRVALSDRYTIERELGAGGMATVYLAHDLKHDRKVAIKVLRPELAAVIGAERFLAEIKTTANLQHPHILPLFDSGAADSFLFYVMPYVEGISLRDRMSREKQLPIAEAVRITTEIAAALDYAHRHGVIHRDIKPENILLHDGSALVADFGIALAASKAGTRMTETGMSLGTPQYMSPEQAMGERELDARSDVYALGCVAYEMLTGEPPFTGPTAQAIVAKVMTAEPAEVTVLRKTVPANIADAVHTALQKLPADRFASAAEFMAALAQSGTTTTHRPTGIHRSAAPAGWRAIAPWGLALVALAVAAWGWFRPAPAPPVIRYALSFPPSQAVLPASQTPVVAPDGSFIIYRGPGEAAGQLWMKRRDSETPTPLPGTAAAQSFAISPDGKWVAFIANARLSKIPVLGGTPVLLLANDSISSTYGLAWTDDGALVYPKRSAAGLMQVSASGDSATQLWGTDSMLALSPSALPDGHGVLFIARPLGLGTSQIMAIKGPGDSAHLLVRGAIGGAFVTPDLLVYSNDDGGMFAVRLDLERLTVTGAPIALGERLGASVGFRAFNTSAAGTLVKLTDDGRTSRNFEMVWVDRTGRETEVDSSWKFQLTAVGANHGWALSPDGSRLAIGLSTGAGDDIWVKPLPAGAPYRVTFDPESDYRPHWTSDSRFITFAGRHRPEGIFQHRADGSGSDSLLLKGIFDEALVSPDSRWLVVRMGSIGAMAGGRNIAGLRLGVDTIAVPVLATEFDEMAIALSPDGKWLAYQSNETGITEVFVRPFPNTDAGKQQVSSGGGVAPLWSRDGKELYYLNSKKEMMASRATAGAMISLSAPVVLFRVREELLGAEANWYTPWDIARDGRFIMARLVSAGGGEAGVVVVENWTQLLKAKVKQ